MDPQLALSAIAVACAGVYLAYRGWRTWRGPKSGCSGGCGCAKTPANEAKEPVLIPSDQLVLRRRTSEPEA